MNSQSKPAKALDRTRKMGKRMRQAYQQQQKLSSTPASISAAIDHIKSLPAPKFTQSIDLAIQISNRPPKDKTVLRGSVVLPHGTGKSTKIGIFADQSEQVTEADKITSVDSPDLKAQISKYDKLGATTAGLQLAAKAAPIIGPMGLMPTAKNNTVMSDPAQLVQFLRNAVIFAEKSKHIMLSIGTTAMTTEQLTANAKAVLDQVFSLAPKDRNIFGNFYLSGTMTPGVKIKATA